jgi:hypothetical protein
VPNDDGQLGNGTLEDKSGQKQGMNDLHDALGTNSTRQARKGQTGFEFSRFAQKHKKIAQILIQNVDIVFLCPVFFLLPNPEHNT